MIQNKLFSGRDGGGEKVGSCNVSGFTKTKLTFKKLSEGFYAGVFTGNTRRIEPECRSNAKTGF